MVRKSTLLFALFVCSFSLYTSSHGPGLAVLTLHMTGFCGDQATASASLTIN